jgi:Asp-tRNA(Asn)/Glu-tRNA(Gln) amidotransferase A subunit family amidase
MNKPEFAELAAIPLRDRLARGELAAVDVAAGFLERIAAREPDVHAFAYFDAQHVMRQAEALDTLRAAGGPTGPLHGLPVGVKDIVDTADMPTENGTPIDAGRRPRADAAVVERLRAAGAIVIGKTVTTELGSMHPGPTRNPHNREHTPGGSSSGSAAAVAAGMMPLAVGTQTLGSVIRPAAFCGVVGFKPSFGAIPRNGILPQATPLDTVGVFARDVADAALLAEALIGHDPRDPDTTPPPAPRLLDVALSPPPAPPRLAFVRSPSWELAAPETKDGLAELTEVLGEACTEVMLPDDFEAAAGALHTLTRAGHARHYGGHLERGGGELSAYMQEAIAEGLRVTALDYLSALDVQRSLSAALPSVLDGYDAIITPAAPGEAPQGLGSTGSPIFNGLWTLCGVPAVTLPLLAGPNGLPVGVQLVGRRGDDAGLLRTARWLWESLRAAGQDASVVAGGRA